MYLIRFWFITLKSVKFTCRLCNLHRLPQCLYQYLLISVQKRTSIEYMQHLEPSARFFISYRMIAEAVTAVASEGFYKEWNGLNQLRSRVALPPMCLLLTRSMSGWSGRRRASAQDETHAVSWARSPATKAKWPQWFEPAYQRSLGRLRHGRRFDRTSPSAFPFSDRQCAEYSRRSAAAETQTAAYECRYVSQCSPLLMFISVYQFHSACLCLHLSSFVFVSVFRTSRRWI